MVDALLDMRHEALTVARAPAGGLASRGAESRLTMSATTRRSARNESARGDLP